MAVQFNYLLDHGGFVANPDGTFAVNMDKIKAGVEGLTHEIMTLQAEGNYEKAKALLPRPGVDQAGSGASARQNGRRPGRHRAEVHHGRAARARESVTASATGAAGCASTFAHRLPVSPAQDPRGIAADRAAVASCARRRRRVPRCSGRAQENRSGAKTRARRNRAEARFAC